LDHLTMAEVMLAFHMLIYVKRRGGMGE